MSTVTVETQLWQMANMVLCGFLVMLSVQQHQMLITAGRFRYGRRMLADFLFCMLWAVGLWLVLLNVSGGLVRNYIILGFTGGALLYQIFFRRRMERICKAGAKNLLILCRWLKKILLLPWELFYRIAGKPCGSLIRNLVRKKKEMASLEEKITENENKFSS